MNSIVHLVKRQNSEHPYGSWKDIKYLARYIKDKTSDSEHPLILHACRIMCSQLNQDWTEFTCQNPEEKNNNVNISLAARWCPREPNYKKKKNVKFGIYISNYG